MQVHHRCDAVVCLAHHGMYDIYDRIWGKLSSEDGESSVYFPTAHFLLVVTEQSTCPVLPNMLLCELHSNAQ